MPSIENLSNAAPWVEVVSTAKDWDDLGAERLLRMHHHMHVVRAFEESVLEVDRMGLINGPAHTSIGQEAGAVGSIAGLNTPDLITGSHRGHHQFIVKGLRHLGDGGNHDPRHSPLPETVQHFLFRTLAEIMGLSNGFCNGRGGSMHLRWVESGAMGTNAIVGGGVPIANGLAWTKKREGNGNVAMTFFGDGSCHIGSVLESLNLASLWSLPLCFFIENNGYAVSTTLAEQTRETRLSSRGGAFAIPAWRVDGMDLAAVHIASKLAIDHMRADKGPTLIEAMVYRYSHHGGGLPGSAFRYRTKDEEAAWRSRDPIERCAREMIDRGWLTTDEDKAIRKHCTDAMGAIIDRLTEAASEGKRSIRSSLWPNPAFRDHGLRGDLSEFEGVRFEEVETATGKVGNVKFVEAVAQVMGHRMETDPRIFCIGEDIHKLNGGTNGATKGLVERFPGRIIGTPIAELGFVGLAGGVALEGSYRPVVELMYADFALVAADQLFNQIGKSRHMFGGDSNMPLVLRTKCAAGTGYGSQHSMDPAGLYSQWPGWRIVAPSTPFDYVGLLNSALLCEDPVLVIEHVDLYNTSGIGPLEDFDYYIPLGKAKVLREGSAFTVLTYLSMTRLALQLADEMGLDVEIIDLRSLDRAGVDWPLIEASIRKTHNVVVLEQGTLTVSYGAMLSDEIQRRFFDELDQPVQRIHGGESSPSVSKVLERAAHVSLEEVRAGFTRMMVDVGLSG